MFQRVVGNRQSAFLLPRLVVDLNLHAKSRGEVRFERLRVGVLVHLEGAVGRGLAGLVRVGTRFDELFRITDGKTLFNDGRCEHFGVRRRDQRAGMAGAEAALGDHFLNAFRQVQKPPRPAFPECDRT